MPSQAQSPPLPQAGGYMWGLSRRMGGGPQWAGASPSQLSLGLPARGLPAAMRGRGGLAEFARGPLAAPGSLAGPLMASPKRVCS